VFQAPYEDPFAPGPPPESPTPLPPGFLGIGEILAGPGDDRFVVTCPAEVDPDLGYNSVWGQGGDDYFESNCPFTDSFNGGDGNDTARIGLGRDFFQGEDGDDVLVDAYSVASDCEDFPPLDPVVAGAIIDRRCIPMSFGAYFMWEDWFVGGPGNDQIFGGEANDHIAGGEGDDRLAGGPGDDLIGGGPGTDECDGGAGSKDYNASPARGTDCETRVNFEFYPQDETYPGASAGRINPTGSSSE
jgi:Ca2+-binding RTX toxin-like protein